MNMILEIGDYWLWQGRDETGRYVFNLTIKGVFKGQGVAGYYNLESLLKMKGLTFPT